MLARLPETLMVVEQVQAQMPRCSIIVGGRGATLGRQLVEAAGA